MDAAESRGNRQRVGNHYSIQENAWNVPMSSRNPSSSSILDSDSSPTDGVKGLDHPVLGFMPDDRKYSNAELGPEKKWWLHLQPNYGHPKNYSKELNTLEEYDIQTYLKANIDSFPDCPQKDSLACIENDGDDTMQEFKAVSPVIGDDLQKNPMNKVILEQWYADDHLMDLDQSEKLCSEMESHWIEVEKTEPWWHTADDLASSVSSKKLEQFENCDIPRPQSKHCQRGPSECPQCFNQDIVLAHTMGTPTSVSLGKMQSILGAEQCLPGSPDRLFRNDDFATESDGEEKLQRLDGNLTKAELLEALCHSQTRAREAEKAAQQAHNEKEHVINLFLRQASHLFAYRQWLQLLQIEETLCLQLNNTTKDDEPVFATSKGGKPWKARRKAAKRKVGSPPNSKHGRPVVAAFALGLGLAGAGLLLGWTMGWLFPTL